MLSLNRPLAIVVLAALALTVASPVVALNDVTSPEKFFGFRLGTDKKLARWDKIVEYYQLLDKESDRIQVIDLGPTTEGHPYLLAIVTSPGEHGQARPAARGEP